MSRRKKLTIVPFPAPPPKVETWEPAAMVQNFLDEITAGTAKPTKMMIVWFSENPETGRLIPHRWFAGSVNHADEIALLELAKAMAIEDWKS